jgi:glycosyltransferase involved in cell wall biosynthesis
LDSISDVEKSEEILQNTRARKSGMSVLHVMSADLDRGNARSGEEQYLVTLIKALSRSADPKPKVTLASFSHDSGLFELIEWSTLFKPISNSARTSSANRQFWSLIKGSDVVHIHQPCSNSGTITVLAAKQSDRRVVITLRGQEKPSSLLIEWSGMNLVDRVICFSEFSAGRIKILPKLPPIEVVRGPVDTDVFVESTPRPPKLCQILCVGPLVPNSGIDLVLQALPNGLDLVVSGPLYSGTYFEHLKDLATGRSVRFVPDPKETQLRSLYESSLCTVSAYHDDGMVYQSETAGLMLLQSMSVGTPVICSSVDALPEFLAGAETGLVFESAQELSAILARVKSGQWPSAAASKACVAHVNENFSLSAVGQKLTSIYAQLAGQNRQ